MASQGSMTNPKSRRINGRGYEGEGTNDQHIHKLTDKGKNRRSDST